MIHDRLFKYISIPLIGFALPVFSGLLDLSQCCWQDSLLLGSVFIIAAYLSWAACTALTRYVHQHNVLQEQVSLRLALSCFLAAICSASLSLGAVQLWMQHFGPYIPEAAILRYCILSCFTAMFTVSVYEVLHQHEGVTASARVVEQLQAERSSLQMGLLQSELEPHFILNSFTSLFHLIKGDPEKAQSFVQNLSRVYKYLLTNKERELISISEELDFIQSYYYLLQIRHDHNIELHFDLDHVPRHAMVIPFALQILVENAVKHNGFGEHSPLHIWIKKAEDGIIVENELQPKPFSVESTNIGLNNLSLRYGLISSKRISIHKSATRFSVYLPLIKK